MHTHTHTFITNDDYLSAVPCKSFHPGSLHFFPVLLHYKLELKLIDFQMIYT